MRKFLTLSVLFVAMFTTLATNNTAYAQPESFTQDYLQEDYRDGEVVRTNIVTVVWDKENNKLTFKNYYSSQYSIYNPAPYYDLLINGTKTWNEDNTVCTFIWTQQKYGQLGYRNFPDFTNYYHLSSNVWGYICPAALNSTSSPYLSAFDGSKPKYGRGNSCIGSINLQTEQITMGPWGFFAYRYENAAPVRVVEYFENSVLTPYKTELVDIVNDGTVGEEYKVYDDLVGVATVDGVLSPAMKVGTNTNSFMIGKGRYKFELDLSTNNVTISQSSEDVTGYVDNNYDTYYIMGEVNGNNWAPNIGQPMKTTDGVHYSAVVECDEEYKENYYFGFTHYLASTGNDWEWNNIAQHRLGPLTNNYPVTLGNVLFAKDMGKYKYPSQISEGQIDFLGRVETEYMGETKLQPVADFDQSNWVMLTGVSNADIYVGKIIKGKSITGKLVDKVNPTIAVTSTPDFGDPNPYDPNIYIMPSFNEAYYAPNSHFFFVTPKVQEYAYITWACFNGNDNNFYAPVENNSSQLDGGIKVSWDYYPAGEPQPGYVYQFDAIVRKVASEPSGVSQLKVESGTPIVSGLNADYIVYPLRLYDVPTAIKTVEATGKAVDVKYYNMMGIESSTPFNGVNIVVTTYDNGTRSNTKKLFK